MSILAEPVMIFATVTGRAAPRTPVAGHPRQPSLTVHSAVPSRRSQPVDALATTEELLCERDRLPAGHPDRAKLRARAIEMNLPMAGRLARRYAGGASCVTTWPRWPPWP